MIRIKPVNIKSICVCVYIYIHQKSRVFLWISPMKELNFYFKQNDFEEMETIYHPAHSLIFMKTFNYYSNTSLYLCFCYVRYKTYL